MRWFKHLVDSGSDPDIVESIHKFGPTGYYVFFRTLEIMAREYSEKDPGTLTIQLDVLKGMYPSIYHVSRLVSILEWFKDRGRILYTISEKSGSRYISLKCPKLKELTEESSTERVRKWRQMKRFSNVSGNVAETKMKHTEPELDKRYNLEAYNQQIKKIGKGHKWDSLKWELFRFITDFKFKVKGEVQKIPQSTATLWINNNTPEYIFRKFAYTVYRTSIPNGKPIEYISPYLSALLKTNTVEGDEFLTWVGEVADQWQKRPTIPDSIKQLILTIKED